MRDDDGWTPAGWDERAAVRGPDPQPDYPDSPYPPLAWWETVRGAWTVTYAAAFLASAALVTQLMNPDGRYLMALGASMLALGLAGSNLRDAYRHADDDQLGAPPE